MMRPSWETLRGKTEDGQDLVISRDYISHGMRSRAQELLTQEPGPRTDLEIRQSLNREVEAERWTGLDRALAREASRNGGIVELRPQPTLVPWTPSMERHHQHEVSGTVRANSRIDWSFSRKRSLGAGQ